MPERPSRRLENPYEADPLHSAAWLGCLHWALGEPDILKQYRRDTGDKYRPPANLLERMVDEATGRDFDFLESFARWMTDNVYGAPS